jgi:CheY-like chemotaxis protein
VHQALSHLYEPDRLRGNPLAAALGVEGRVDTFTRLQTILIEAIDALEPSPDDPAYVQRCEIHEPLYYRYVQQMPQQQVAEQLGMSIRHLRRKEHAAVEVLAGWLWDRYGLAEEPEGAAGGAEANGAQPPDVNDELAWLRDTPVEAPADLPAAIRQALELVAPIAGQYRVQVETCLGDDLPGLALHGAALNQMLLNLLTVAVHQAAGGKIALSAVRADVGVLIQVRARIGPGAEAKLSAGDAENISLAARLARLSRGRLHVQETASGYLAELTLPPLGQHTVLVVDDNADTLQLLRRYAAGSRYRLLTCREPERALEMAQQHQPHAIVLDVMMPRMDGWSVLGHLHEHPATRPIPVLVCTIVAQREMALALGAAGYLQKPVTRRGFLDALDALVDHPATEPL